MIALLPALARPLLEPGMPDDVTVRWFASPEEANAGIADADIAWVDMQPPHLVGAALARARALRWVSTIYAGLDSFPLAHLQRLGATLTNGSGINANAVAEYAVLGVLAAAKRIDKVCRAQERREWLRDSPGKVELAGTRALIVGHGTIGRLIGTRLAAFDVAVTGVRRGAGDGCLGPDEWQGRLGEFDWVILAAPSTAETKALIGAAELAAMKPGAWLVNIARGDMVDQVALLGALRQGRIGGAFLDTVDPEPLPPSDPLWTAPNTFITMHLSGRSQTLMFQRAAALFLDNLAAFRDGRPMANVVDLSRGY